MRIYTRRGDTGQTDLIGGSRVGKDHLRVRCFGCVDELNATLGLAIAGCDDDAIKTPLITVQHRLFDLGAQLASPDPPKPAPPAQQAEKPPLEQEIEDLERVMDQADARLEPLRAFILPGGVELSARLHLTRAVCRRAERITVELNRTEPIDPLAIRYLNRLSDLLFVLARLANHLAGVDDVRWVPREPGDPKPDDPPPDPPPG